MLLIASYFGGDLVYRFDAGVPATMSAVPGRVACGAFGGNSHDDTYRDVVDPCACCLPRPRPMNALSRAPWKERAVLRTGQVVQGDYFAFGPHVEISGIVNGDLYAAGGEVLIDGVVQRRCDRGGAKVILSGTVAQDARVAGAQVVSIS